MSTEDNKPVCDLVLEGGVTSALIYTHLIARLSTHYRFKSFGGTSSGAGIAAAGAIAERSRRELLKKQASGQSQELDAEKPFEVLRTFPDELAKTECGGRKRTRLLRLFQPQARTAKSFRIVSTLLKCRSQRKGWLYTARISFCAVIRNHPIAAALLTATGAVLGAIVCLISLAASLGSESVVRAMFLVAPLPIVLACLPNVFLGVVLGLLLVVPYAFWSAFSGLRANHFGLCNGMNGEDRGDADALTERLHTLYNGLLKRSPEDDPVCFRDLWGAGAAAGDREINLQVITTALNLRRPYRVPNDPGVEPLREFLYDPAEWKELFPPAVMDWLAKDWKERNPQSPDGIQCKCPGVTLRSLPPASRLPILVAVRMSVAFPGLLSAVPMYTVERKRRPASRASAASAPSPSDDQAFIARRVYFADGGITSNCPVHLFDAPLPRHPTFVVSLDVLPDGAKDMGPRDRICLQGGDVERPDTVRRFESGGPLREALSFLWSIVDTSINWRDSLQRTVPGSEERVAIVKLKANEGSLNLHMDPPTIGAVADLGSHAADKFIEAFAGPRTNGQSNAWDRHRWIRMRSTIATARNYLHAIWIAETKNEAGYRRTLVSSKQLDPWFSNAGSVETAIALLEKLNALGFDPLSAAKSEPTEPGTDPASTWPDVSYNQPTPAPRLHMSPPW